MVATCQKMVREKKFLKVREKSRNFTFSQGKIKCLKEVREKWNFKSTYNLLFSLYFLILLFSNIKILLYVSQT